ncbi:hypothetical protein RM553_08745 [Zunongwangia sp. F363]|uniref:Uncharacterized protein n=1 Tax=Autumnicola tepida TaxID=3075595 RepID=A0ABU3C9C8_9FLAO|nr:hypothetical protein [Zunongwangia sp. F363]MDT0642916.1 hypothetical protein [Zunongwangia sp. F363]
MKKMLKFTLLIMLPLLTLSCSDDDDNLSDELIYYDLMISNDTENDIIIYLNATSDTRGFVNNGNIAAGENLLVTDLEADVLYEIRAVNAGGELEDFFIEMQFENDNEEQQSISIEN